MSKLTTPPDSAPNAGAVSLTSAMQPSPITSLPLIYRGKVRDIHKIDEQHWLIVATDRASAFDVIMPTPIPGKGRLLTELALFWFQRYASLIDNHLVDLDLADILSNTEEVDYATGRSMIVKRLEPLPVEAVVRGYLAGSGWKDYSATGDIAGVALPAGLQLGDRLEAPVFTPATKAALGDHDENISFEQMADSVGEQRATEIRDVSLSIYADARSYAAKRGILLADTKFEFGVDADGKLVLMDEILTPDSSRYWDATQWRPGVSPASLDKQFLRDWLETLDWNKQAPGPELPDHIIEGTLKRYQEAVDRLKAPA